MTVDKFGQSPKTGQNVANLIGASYEYVNSNVLRKGQATDMSGQSIVNLGKSRGSKDTVRRKYVNERFFYKGDSINMNQKAIKNVLPPTEEGDAATKGYVDSKSTGESDLNMNGNSIRHINTTLIQEDEVVLKQWIENNFLNRYSLASTMARDLNMEPISVFFLTPEITRTKSPRSDKSICRYEAAVFGWGHAGRHWDGWKQDFTLGRA